MRVVYAGDFSQTWHSETHVARELEGLGHTVAQFSGPPQTLTEACEGADLLLLQANGGFTGDMRPVFGPIEARGTRTASYHLDLFVGLGRSSRIDLDPMFQTQVVFTADGDLFSQIVFAAKNVVHRWLPPAVVNDETERGTWRDEYDYDVVFVGSRHYHPEWTWRRTLLDGLTARYGSRFRVFDHHPPTRDQDLNDLYATARVVVGDSLCLPGHTQYFSDRYFETIGRGGFLIAPRIPGLENFLTDGEHYVGYDIGDLDKVCSLVDLFLDEPEARERIRTHGHAHVATRHTYRHRMVQMLSMLDLAVAA